MTPNFFKLGRDKAPAPVHTSAELEVEGVGRFKISHIATVGRSCESQVVINVRSVSRQHARIFYEGGHFWIKDLDSANGTQVNGKKITLQMLADQDKICFGEACAVFHTAVQPGGPAPLGTDPWADSEESLPDGTPTGGLRAPFSPAAGRTQREVRPVKPEASQAMATEMQELARNLERLQTENELLRRDASSARSTTQEVRPAKAASGEHEEINRLRKLVARLERALADSNLRLRNLQQRLDEKESGPGRKS
jgi:pSer/pThr/pTyr-binding forkhead associated (FHA) protein